MPVLVRYAIALRAMLRGSRLYASPVIGSWMKKFSTSVFADRNGSTYAVVGSGNSDMSDSWIAWKPRIEEPSKFRPSSKTDWSKDETGTVKCCITPGRSQNRTSTIATPSSLMYFSSSSLFANIRPPGPDRTVSCAGCARTRRRDAALHHCAATYAAAVSLPYLRCFTHVTACPAALAARERGVPSERDGTGYRGEHERLPVTVAADSGPDVRRAAARAAGPGPRVGRGLGPEVPGAVRGLGRLPAGGSDLRRPGRALLARLGGLGPAAGVLRGGRGAHAAGRRLLRAGAG